MFVPRIHMGLAEATWFPDMFPEECNLAVRLDNGRPDLEYRHDAIGKPQHSMASKKWREMAGKAMERFVREVEAFCGDRIIGYHVGGRFTAEWFTWHIVNRESIDDYSSPMLRAFREYVRNKYLDDDSLRKAWSRNDVTLDTVNIPDVFRRENPSLGAFYSTAFEQDIIDYQECFGHEGAASCIHLCRTVKEVVDWKKIVGVFNGYFLTFNRTLVPQRTGHMGFDEILNSDVVDFIASPYAYEYRGWGQNHHAQTVPITIQERGKLYVDEIDTNPQGMEGVFDWIRGIYTPESIREYCEMLKRDFAYNQAIGSAFWWMDILNAGWYSPPEVTETLRKLITAEKMLTDMKKGSAAEIAVVLDMSSYASVYPGPTHQEPYIAFLIQWEMPRIGTPFDVLFLEDFLSSKKAYKLAIFPQAASLHAERASRLMKHIRHNNISTMWFHAPGHCISDEKIQGTIDWKWRVGEQGLCNVTMTNTGHWLAEGIPDGTEYGATANLEERSKDSFTWEPSRDRTARRIIIEDDDAVSVGTLSTGEGTGLAVKERNGSFSILSSAPAPPSALVRNAARKAGVNLYSPLGDIVSAGKHFLGISAGFEGDRELRLPKESKVIDLESGDVIVEKADRFNITLKYGHCGLYALVPKD